MARLITVEHQPRLDARRSRAAQTAPGNAPPDASRPPTARARKAPPASAPTRPPSFRRRGRRSRSLCSRTVGASARSGCRPWCRKPPRCPRFGPARPTRRAPKHAWSAPPPGLSNPVCDPGAPARGCRARARRRTDRPGRPPARSRSTSTTRTPPAPCSARPRLAQSVVTPAPPPRLATEITLAARAARAAPQRLADLEQRAHQIALRQRRKQHFVRAGAQHPPHQRLRLLAQQRKQDRPRRHARTRFCR